MFSISVFAFPSHCQIIHNLVNMATFFFGRLEGQSSRMHNRNINGTVVYDLQSIVSQNKSWWTGWNKTGVLQKLFSRDFKRESFPSYCTLSPVTNCQSSPLVWSQVAYIFYSNKQMNWLAATFLLLQALPGQSSLSACKPCKPGQFSVSYGEPTCTLCSPGFYQVCPKLTSTYACQFALLNIQ